MLPLRRLWWNCCVQVAQLERRAVGGARAAHLAGDLVGADDAGGDFLLVAAAGGVPPGVLVADGQRLEPPQHVAQPGVAAAVRRPAHHVEHLARGEIDGRVGEVAAVLGDVEQGEDDVLVGRRRQAVAGRRREGDALPDALAGDGVVARGLELQAVALAAVGVAGLLALQGGDGEVREVHLVAAVVVLPLGGVVGVHGRTSLDSEILRTTPAGRWCEVFCSSRLQRMVWRSALVGGRPNSSCASAHRPFRKGASSPGNPAPRRTGIRRGRRPAARGFMRGRTRIRTEMCPAARKIDISAHRSQLRSWEKAAAQLPRRRGAGRLRAAAAHFRRTDLAHGRKFPCGRAHFGRLRGCHRLGRRERRAADVATEPYSENRQEAVNGTVETVGKERSLGASERLGKGAGMARECARVGTWRMEGWCSAECSVLRRIHGTGRSRGQRAGS